MHTDIPVQSTFDEWKTSGFEQGCQDCHMGGSGHSFPGGHSQSLLKGSVEVEVRRIDNGVEATLQSKGVAHALPTGDPFRRLIWKLCTDEQCSIAIAKQTFAIVHSGPKWSVQTDRRLHPGQPVTLSYQAPNTDLWWELSYRYGDPIFEHHLSEKDVQTIVHKGRVSSIFDAKNPER